jgi:hypothetical protein
MLPNLYRLVKIIAIPFCQDLLRANYLAECFPWAMISLLVSIDNGKAGQADAKHTGN